MQMVRMILSFNRRYDNTPYSTYTSNGRYCGGYYDSVSTDTSMEGGDALWMNRYTEVIV